MADVSGGGSVALRQWSVDLIAVPEPAALGIATAFGLLAAAAVVGRKRHPGR